MNKTNPLYKHIAIDYKIMAERRRENDIKKYGTMKDRVRLNKQQQKRKCYFCGVTQKIEYTQKIMHNGKNLRICFSCMERRN